MTGVEPMISMFLIIPIIAGITRVQTSTNHVEHVLNVFYTEPRPLLLA